MEGVTASVIRSGWQQEQALCKLADKWISHRDLLAKK